MTDQTPRTEAGRPNDRSLSSIAGRRRAPDFIDGTRDPVYDEGYADGLADGQAQARAYWVQRAMECEAWVEAHPLEVAVSEARADERRRIGDAVRALDMTAYVDDGYTAADDVLYRVLGIVEPGG